MKQNTLIPEYMKKFQCIGGDCEDTCCAGWTVSIDKQTYKKYQKATDPELKTKLNSFIKRNKNTATKSDRYYASIIMGKDKHCPMLTEEKWCSVQLKMGEGALSTTCRMYPRNLNKYNDTFEFSGRVSCPEIARLVLLEPKGIEFDETEYEIQPNWPVIKHHGNDGAADYTQHFWPIRMLAIEMIQTRTIALGDRLVLLGLFIDALQKDIDQGLGLGAADIIESFRSKLMSAEYLESISKLSVNLDLQLQALFELIKSRLTYGATMDRYHVTFTEMLEGLKLAEADFKLDEFRVNYEENFNAYYSPYMKEKEYVLENYLVNFLFNSLFPNLSVKNNSLFDEYALLAVMYGMLKIHLVGVAGKHKVLNDEIVVRTVQSFAKAIEHTSVYLQSIVEELKRNNYYTLAHISLLVKD
ncbi:hypothetical protein PC41400_02720 [Paenibacillus chitinolyticus]|uniref:Flagellin lysine-N-methylase n=1 Tax=Paenibacillus chitinolyticus TaxID=79263 RepID=A0A410WQM9_9BACL|nr:flagellin lysine-N-methylase [Paenibacillus chitinolyticus]MCY9591684.1 flagellin lysine-N-methylase [Paenibacillus chitinolyticus]MCY9596043.1 flagellin lysine-N-methylase [Paenibacillus chitinolyticus]QAV16665.1 hypothetical protein PC41400_02720 [Paenibacillus chitinolyticus]